MVRRVPPHRAYLRIGSEGAKEGGGALAGSGSGHRCAAPAPPGSRRPAVDSSQAADQMGISRWTQGRSLSPARPIPPRKEVTGALRTPARPLGWGGGRLWATSARGGCGSVLELPTMVWRRGRRRGP